MNNIFNLDNWLLVGQAGWKMAGFFWPVLLLAAIFVLIEARKEAA